MMHWRQQRDILVSTLIIIEDKKLSELDVLVLNAGISQRDLFEQTNFSTAELIMNINFMSYVALTKVL